MGSEEEKRREAVLRVLAGEPPSKVAADLGRSDRWVRKWVARYDPADEARAADLSRAPRTQAAKSRQEGHCRFVAEAFVGAQHLVRPRTAGHINLLRLALQRQSRMKDNLLEGRFFCLYRYRSRLGMRPFTSGPR